MFLITGAEGQLGRELAVLLNGQAEFVGRRELDIADEQAVFRKLDAKKYDAIINCAAYTAVDQAELDEKTAQCVNALGPLYLARSGLPLIQISTDYVFSGKNCSPYREDDCPNPQSVYGRTKLQGEQNALDAGKTVVVLRTSWLYSSYGRNFVKTMQRLGAEKKEINVVCDQIGTPTYAADLAQIIVDILPKMSDGMKEIFHFSNEGVCSWYDFALEIMELSGLSCRVNPIESKDYPTAAIRPFYSVLNKTKIKSAFHRTIPHWKESLKQCLKKIF